MLMNIKQQSIQFQSNFPNKQHKVDLCVVGGGIPGIPYRSLYSRNISNLMFAGRLASCTYVAMSSTRVMGTGATMGQAVGTAVAIAVKKGIFPAGILDHVDELQQTLLWDDAYLPGVTQTFLALTTQSQLTVSKVNPEPVRDGIHRQEGADPHCWESHSGDSLTYTFPGETLVQRVTLILDSGMDQNIQMSYHQADNQLTSPPDVMPKVFRLQGLIDGEWQDLIQKTKNYQRFVRIEINQGLSGIRYILDETWGAENSRVYGFFIE